MSKIAIIYATKTKHSKKLADAMASALNVKALDALASPALGETDLLFIVAGIYGGQSLPKLLEYVKTLDNSKIKKVALVTSSAGEVKKQDSVRQILTEKGIEVVDEFACCGSFLFVKMGRPNDTDVQQTVDYAKRIAKVVG